MRDKENALSLKSATDRSSASNTVQMSCRARLHEPQGSPPGLGALNQSRGDTAQPPGSHHVRHTLPARSLGKSTRRFDQALHFWKWCRNGNPFLVICETLRCVVASAAERVHLSVSGPAAPRTSCEPKLNSNHGDFLPLVSGSHVCRTDDIIVARVL